jgi:hypothetical protein
VPGDRHHDAQRAIRRDPTPGTPENDAVEAASQDDLVRTFEALGLRDRLRPVSAAGRIAVQ